MSISSVSSGSGLWELLNRQAQAKKSKAADGNKPAIDPMEMIKELEKLKDDPEQLKAKAAELYAEITAAAEGVEGREAEMLSRVAEDLAAVAESGDLSVMTDKMPKPAEADGSGLMSAGGLNGAQGASMKWIEALLEEEDDEAEEEISVNSTPDLFGQLSKLLEKDQSQFVKTVTELAEEAREKAEAASDEEAEKLNLLAVDLEDAAATGTLSAMEERMADAQDQRNIGGYDSSTAASMMYIQAQIMSFGQRVA